jgi:hypothetical protein
MLWRNPNFKSRVKIVWHCSKSSFGGHSRFAPAADKKSLGDENTNTTSLSTLSFAIANYKPLL